MRIPALVTREVPTRFPAASWVTLITAATVRADVPARADAALCVLMPATVRVDEPCKSAAASWVVEPLLITVIVGVFE